MVSIDKDMQTIPGRLYNPNKSDLGTRTISVDDAGLFWVKQALTGDQIDHYTGFPGIGHKLADEIFMPIHEANLDETPRSTWPPCGTQSIPPTPPASRAVGTSR